MTSLQAHNSVDVSPTRNVEGEKADTEEKSTPSLHLCIVDSWQSESRALDVTVTAESPCGVRRWQSPQGARGRVLATQAGGLGRSQ